MNHLRLNLTVALIALTLALSCNEPKTGFSRIEYIIPDHINIKTEDLGAEFGEFKTDAASPYYIVVILYSYSSGAERISFAGGDDVKTVTGNGKLKGLVKVMDGKRILRAEFAEGAGGNDHEMISSLVKEIKLKLMK